MEADCCIAWVQDRTAHLVHKMDEEDQLQDQEEPRSYSCNLGESKQSRGGHEEETDQCTYPKQSLPQPHRAVQCHSWVILVVETGQANHVQGEEAKVAEADSNRDFLPATDTCEFRLLAERESACIGCKPIAGIISQDPCEDHRDYKPDEIVPLQNGRGESQ